MRADYIKLWWESDRFGASKLSIEYSLDRVLLSLKLHPRDDRVRCLFRCPAVQYPTNADAIPALRIVETMLRPGVAAL